MGKTRIKENFRVEVEPRGAGDFGFATIGGMEHREDEAISLCEDIASQIRRHVDGLPSNGRGVSVVWDTYEECEHCGSRWTEGDSPHNGGCCHADEITMNESA